MNRVTGIGLVALALGACAEAQSPAQVAAGKKVTIVTTGHVEQALVMGKRMVVVIHASTPGPPVKKEVDGPIRYTTEGVVVAKGETLEFLSLAEAKERFKDLAGASALCEVEFDGTATHCKAGECKGACTLHGKPEYCGCQ